MPVRRIPVRPKQSLGQNFLVDDNIIRKTIHYLAPSVADCFVEIGPGNGALSRQLLPLVKSLVMVEIDGRVIRDLRTEFRQSNVTIIHDDILGTDFTALRRTFGQKFRIVGNIPYHLTSPILFKVLDHTADIVDCTVMVQREVARRVVAKPKTKEYGIMSVLSRYCGSARVLFDVSPDCFYPKPRVISSVIQLKLDERPRYNADKELFRTVVRTTFGKRRKTLRNSLHYLPYDEEDIAHVVESITFPLDKRPEDLGVEEFVALTREVESHLSKEVKDKTWRRLVRN